MNQAFTQGRLAPAPQTSLRSTATGLGRVASWVVLLAIYVAWPAFQIVDYVAAQPFALALDVVNYAASIAAYNWLLLNVLLGLKLPVLQRAFPYDFRIRAHIITSSLVTAFIAWHAVYYIFLMEKQISVLTWTLLGIFATFLAASLLWIPLPGFRRFREAVTRVVKVGLLRSYDALKAVHKVLFVALAGVTYLHILDAKLIGVASAASSFGFQFLFVVTAAAFFWTRIQNLVLPSLEIVSVSRHGSTTKLALAGSPRVRYQAGQFAFLRFQHPALKHEEHPFSFISAGHESTVEFAVKDLGDFTGKLAELKPGDKVKVNAGFGAFRPRKASTPLALIGTGIGAVPLVSLAKELSVSQPDRPVVCFVSARSRTDIVDLDRLEAIAADRPNFRLHVLAQDEGAPLLDQASLKAALGEPKAYEFFLCSSNKVRLLLIDALTALGVKGRQIHYEAFGLG